MGRAGWAGVLTVVAAATLLLTGCGAEVAGVAAGGVSRSLTAPSLPSSTATAGSSGSSSSSSTATASSTASSSSTVTTTTTSTTAGSSTTRSTSSARSTRSTTGTLDSVGTAFGDRGAIEVGDPDAPVVIDVYEDPLCPPCADFSERYSRQLHAAALSGTVLLRLRLANFLDPESASKSYSTRATGALLSVLAFDRRPEVVLAVNQLIFSHRYQPREGASTDLSDARLATLVEGVGGSSASVTSTRTGQAHSVARSTAELTRKVMAGNGISGVPAVQVNGTSVDIGNENWLTEALGG